MNILQMGKRLGASGTVVAILEGHGQYFDLVLYPAAIAWLGPVKGGLIMTALSFMTSYLIIVWYNQTDRDWFGVEWLRLQENTEGKTFSGRALRFFLRMGKWPAYVAITIYDPAYGFIYLRGRKSNGLNLTRTDWKWFVVSELIGNLAWILLVTGVIEIIKHLFF